MAYNSWYCGLPGFISDRIESCIPTAQDQVEIMRGNFGGHSDPTLVNQAVNDWQQWLEDTGYEDTVQKLEIKDRQGKLFGLLAIVALGAFVFGSVLVGGPRRYGR